MAGTGYKTKQRMLVEDYLRGLKGTHITAKALCEGLQARGVKIGAATVYRQLDHLVEDGVVRKYLPGPGDAACFAYVGQGGCEHEHCFHCVCTECGRLYHVECDDLAHISEHLAHEHGFTIDPQRTVFYGICDACAGVR